MTNPMPELRQLPNKDLWRGSHIHENPPVSVDTEVVAETAQNPVNRAMAQILQSAAGARELTCLWCGMQGDEKSIRVHLTVNHPNVVNPMGNAEAALATLAVQQKGVIEKAANS